jgi:hypothetical protein
MIVSGKKALLNQAFLQNSTSHGQLRLLGSGNGPPQSDHLHPKLSVRSHCRVQPEVSVREGPMQGYHGARFVTLGDKKRGEQDRILSY